MITYEAWLELTDAGFLAIRSGSLKALDQALYRYHENGLRESDFGYVESAFQSYLRSEGTNWKLAKRNSKRALEILFDDLKREKGSDHAPPTDKKEIEAWAALKELSRKDIHTLFTGKQLEWRPGILKKLGNVKWGTANSTMGVATNLRQAIKPSGSDENNAFARKILEYIPDIVRNEVMSAMEEIVPRFAMELAIGLAPFVGVVKSSAQAVWSIHKAMQACDALEQARLHIDQAFVAGDMLLATRALDELLTRDRTSKLFGATINSATAISKAVLLAADGGTASNAMQELATSTAKLLNILRIVTRDCLERRSANNAIRTQTIDASIFEECPILGAYMICCVPSSKLVNGLVEKPHTFGWKGNVEFTLKHHWDPLREKARKFATEHRFYIRDLERHPAMLETSNTGLIKMWIKHKFGMSDMPNAA